MDDNKKPAGFRLRIYVRSEGADSNEKDIRLLEVCRNLENRDVSVYLANESKIASLGWIPEIVYGTKETGDILDIVIKPKFGLPSEQSEMRPDSRDVLRDETHESPLETRHPVASETALLPKVSHGEEILYRVTVDNREIRINEFRLSRPKFDSENQVVMDYLLRNPNRKVTLTEIEEAIERPVNKRLGEIVRDLGFKRELKEMFFPDVSKSAIRFINPITATDIQRRGLRRLGISTN